MTTSSLRYSVQHKDGLRWYTAKAYAPEGGRQFPEDDFGFLLACKVANSIAATYKRPARVLLMPGNVVAHEVSRGTPAR